MSDAMNDGPDATSEIDIAAFVEGQLDAEQRLAVTGYLAAHPARAAEVMGEWQRAEALRLALGGLAAPAPAATLAAADRLQRGLTRRGLLQRVPWRSLRGLAAAGVLFGLGMGTQTLLPRPGDGQQALIDAALAAQDAMKLRLAMAATPETGLQDVREITRALGIAVPSLPPGWILRDAQVVATPDNPGLAMVLDTPDIGQVILVAVPQAPGEGPDPSLRTTVEDGRPLATFEKGRTAYVLVDNAGPASDIESGALRLRNRLN